ncbi:MAG: hypothetical protein MRZ34_03040 [Bacillales bacterium]|nr:hypothetical protein [Bacillales bacterium]
MKKQVIYCDVFDCKYCDCNKECCKLSSIRVSTSLSENPKYSTMCENFKEIK